MSTSVAVEQPDADPWKYFWYAVYVAVMAVTSLPLIMEIAFPRILSYVSLLLIHEFAAFLYVGHTFFSNIWAMRIRMTQPAETGVWARGFLRKLALSITLPTSIITPLAGLFLVAYLGGFALNPWAKEAYFAFWLMAGVSVVPDVIRYGRNRHARDPRHGVLSGAIRGNFGTLMVIWILWCMITKQALFFS